MAIGGQRARGKKRMQMQMQAQMQTQMQGKRVLQTGMFVRWLGAMFGGANVQAGGGKAFNDDLLGLGLDG